MKQHDFDNDPRRRDKAVLTGAIVSAGGSPEPGKKDFFRCCFHAEKTGSMHVHRGQDGVWRGTCFGCGQGGDVYDVEAHAAGLSRIEYLKRYVFERDSGRSEYRAPRPREGQPMENAGYGSDESIAGGDVLGPNDGEVGVAGAVPEEEAAPKEVFPTVEALVAKLWNVVDVFEYTNPDTGVVDLVAVKTLGKDGKKGFFMGRPCEGGYCFGSPPKPWPLFNRTRALGLKESNWVARGRCEAVGRFLVVEGEKCVKVAAKYGVVAVTSPGGSKSGDKADWSLLAGEEVVIWPDHDEPGKGYADVVQGILERLEPPALVYRVNPAGMELPAGGDIADWVAGFLEDGMGDGFIQGAIRDVMEDATIQGPVGSLRSHYEDIFSGKFRTEELAWPQITRLTRALLPGTVTLLCGDPGSSKSFFLNECCLYWLRERNLKVAVYHLEEDRDFHLKRALAQLEGEADFFDDEWSRRNEQRVRGALKEHEAFLDRLGRCIWDAPDYPPNIKDLAKWVTARCEEGYRIVAIDPVTVAGTSERPWVDHQLFMVEVKKAVRKAGASLLLVTHPKDGNKVGAGWDGMAGGKAFPRFSQTIIWIEAIVAQVLNVVVAGMGGTFEVVPYECNRKWHLVKARSGRGAMLTLAANFVGKELRFQERGILDKKKKAVGKTEKAEKSASSEPEDEEDPLLV